MTLRSGTRGIFWAVLLLLATATPSLAQTGSIDFQELMKDLLKEASSPDVVTSVWWIAPEFLQAAAEAEGASQADTDELVGVMRDYSVFLAVDGTVGPFGGIRYVSEDALSEAVVLVDADGVRYQRLASDDIDPDMRNMLAMMVPAIRAPMGSIGEHWHVFVFPSTSPRGARIADASAEGRFSVMVGSEQFTWETPLGSVVPKKICPVDWELLNGTWNYCPKHGNRLRTAAEAESERKSPRAALPVSEDVVDEIPVQLSCPAVAYPEALLESGTSGAVNLEFIIEKDGTVVRENIRITGSTHRAFEEPAVTAVAQCHYAPGRIDGEPVRTRVKQPLRFFAPSRPAKDGSR